MKERPRLIVSSIHDDHLVQPDMMAPEHKQEQCVIHVDGSDSLPATLSLMTHGKTREAAEEIIIRLCGPNGLMLHCAISPATARLFCQSLSAATDDVEQYALGRAEELLRKAGGAQP